MPYDPTIYHGSAAHYLRGRPRYSAELAPTLRREHGLDGHGRLLDAGCGPGVLAVELAGLFDEVVGSTPTRPCRPRGGRCPRAPATRRSRTTRSPPWSTATSVPGGGRGRGFSRQPPDRYEDALARTRFGPARFAFAPGRTDVVRDVDSIVAGVHSLSWAARHLVIATKSNKGA